MRLFCSLCLFLLGSFASALTPNAASPYLGVRGDELVAALGEPQSRSEAGNRQLWVYSNDTYTLQEGRVVDVRVRVKSRPRVEPRPRVAAVQGPSGVAHASTPMATYEAEPSAVRTEDPMQRMVDMKAVRTAIENSLAQYWYVRKLTPFGVNYDVLAIRRMEFGELQPVTGWPNRYSYRSTHRLRDYHGSNMEYRYEAILQFSESGGIRSVEINAL